jgi:hypothetical protein
MLPWQLNVWTDNFFSYVTETQGQNAGMSSRDSHLITAEHKHTNLWSLPSSITA